jgi:deoxyribonuclease-4
MERLGYHFSIAGPSDKIYSTIREISENYGTGQIFLSSPQQTQGKDITKRLNKVELNKIKKIIQKNKFRLFIHGNYLVNFAIPNQSILNIVIAELVSAEYLGAAGVIFHVGKTKKLMAIGKGIQSMIDNIVYVLKKISKLRVRLLLESSAGVGSEIGSNLNEFSKIVNSILERIKGTVSENNFGVCLDTAHLHSSGIDLQTKKAAKKFITEFHKKIGLSHVKAIHFNDSERELGSRVDRHCTIGTGYITLNGNDGMKYIAQVAKKLDIPLILERSDKFHSDLVGEFELVQSWLK